MESKVQSAPALEIVQAEGLGRQMAQATNVVTPMDLLSMAMAQGADLDRLERLMAMKQQYEADEARKAYYSDLAGFKSEAIEIVKRKRVYFKTDRGVTDYKHAELSDVVETVGPPLSKHGFSWSWGVDQAKDWIKVTCTLKHRLGHTECVTMGGPPDKTGGKNDIQAVISTTTYLERHTLKAITGTSEKGDDNDGRGGANVANDDGNAGSRQAPATAPAAEKIDRTLVMKCRSNLQEHLAQGRDLGALQEWEAATDMGEEFAAGVWAGLTSPEREAVRKLRGQTNK